MGSSMSSSSIDRRTNALRRSQRKSITGACSGIDKLLKTLKNFKCSEDSEEYKNMKIRIIQIEKNLQQKVQEVQPQFKTIYNITQQKINTAYAILEQKAQENCAKEGADHIVLNGQGKLPPSPPIVQNNNVEVGNSQKPNGEIIPNTQFQVNENKRNSLLLRLSKLTGPKRESKSSSSQLEVTADVHKTPETTRKSIMKYGVPVLPSPTSNRMSSPTSDSPKLVSFNTPDDFDSSLVRNEKRIKLIKQDIANLEIRINEFVGRKGGRHYSNLRGALTNLVEELEGINEEELLDQVVMCHNYIKSCYNFLDSKAVDEEDVDDEVFTNYTNSKIYGSTHDLLEGNSVRTTAI